MRERHTQKLQSEWGKPSNFCQWNFMPRLAAQPRDQASHRTRAHNTHNARRLELEPSMLETRHNLQFKCDVILCEYLKFLYPKAKS
jgi:hypothetical protein